MARAEQSIGEALVGLLEDYGVDTVFGIPGVHNVELYRALPRSGIRHVLPRHEQGAGFMADGYARATGRPGVCFVITGPGLTNILTPVGQAYSDSVPMLVLASTLDVADASQGRGRLHEMLDQRGAAATVAASAATAYTAADAQDRVAQAFAAFASERPRPHYVEFPIDVMNAPCGDGWTARTVPGRPDAKADDVRRAVEMLRDASAPVMVIGGGARFAGDAVARIAEATGAVILTTVAGKGVVPESHALNAGALLPQTAAQELVQAADVVLAAGTEFAETDFWNSQFRFDGALIRIDLDSGSLARPHPAAVAIRADAGQALSMIAAELADDSMDLDGAKAKVLALKEITDVSDSAERAVLDILREALPAETMVVTDMTLIAYTGNEVFPVEHPNCWHHPSGFGTLGYALPAAIGAKVGVGDKPVVALAGDYGFQYTINELATAAELGLSLPILVWNNSLLGAIHRDMVEKGIQPNAVTQVSPDFPALARAYGCHADKPATPAALRQAIAAAFEADGPTLIEMTPELVKG